MKTSDTVRKRKFKQFLTLNSNTDSFYLGDKNEIKNNETLNAFSIIEIVKWMKAKKQKKKNTFSENCVTISFF